MAPLEKVIRTLVESLPGHAEAIERAYAESEHFRSICADYHACTEALTHWMKMESEEASAQRQEYQDLLQELQEEVLSWLEAWEGPTDPDRH